MEGRSEGKHPTNFQYETNINEKMTVSIDGEGSPPHVYHVIRETTDILYDYGDSEVRGVYKTLDEANEAAKKDLFKEYKMSELEDYSEIPNKDGTLHVNAGTAEVDFVVKVVRRSVQPDLRAVDRAVYIVNRTETASFKTATGTATEKVSKAVGVYQKEDSANEAAELELRKAAGIKTWSDRRKFKGVFREEYDLEGLFEGVAIIKQGKAGASHKEIALVVERRTLE